MWHILMFFIAHFTQILVKTVVCNLYKTYKCRSTGSHSGYDMYQVYDRTLIFISAYELSGQAEMWSSYVVFKHIGGVTITYS